MTKSSGLILFIEKDEVWEDEFVAVVDTDSGQDMRLQLENQPIACRRAIVGRSTSCYPTQDRQGVVKFSWTSASRSPTEYDLLKLAKERSVRGIPRLVGYRRVVTIGELRSPLAFSKKRHMKGRQSGSTSLSTQSGSLPLSDEETKRKFTDPDQGSSKKARSNSRASKLSQVNEADSFNDSVLLHALQVTNEQFVDRVISYQATQPFGVPLAKFNSVIQLLQALRDAIKVHRSLLLDGKILHRDVSGMNIIIVDLHDNEGFSGMLIDLELGTILEDGKNTRTGLKHMTGTLK